MPVEYGHSNRWCYSPGLEKKVNKIKWRGLGFLGGQLLTLTDIQTAFIHEHKWKHVLWLIFCDFLFSLSQTQIFSYERNWQEKWLKCCNKQVSGTLVFRFDFFAKIARALYYYYVCWEGLRNVNKLDNNVNRPRKLEYILSDEQLWH